MSKLVPKAIRYFGGPADFRAWLAKYHGSRQELWVGFHRKHTGRPSLTWPQSVDEALCYGWIDGIRITVDPDRYTIRFTPRKPGSNWSAVNVRRATELIRLRRMRAAGRKAFEARDGTPAGYSYEDRPDTLSPALLRRLKAHRDAWRDFQARPPWYRRAAAHWVASARKEETRERRFAVLLACSAAGRTVPPLTRK